MSTPFNVRSMAAQAGIQTTGGFAVIAECVTLEEIERFAALVAAAEREACAQILDGVDSYANPMTANDCADAIRARGKA